MKLAGFDCFKADICNPYTATKVSILHIENVTAVEHCIKQRESEKVFQQKQKAQYLVKKNPQIPVQDLPYSNNRALYSTNHTIHVVY